MHISGEATRMDIEITLRKVPFFADFTESQIHQVAVIGEITPHTAGYRIFKEGEQADRFYIIVNGSVRVYGGNPEGEEVTYNIFEEGDYLGELALLDGEVRSASATCLEPTTFFTLERGAFRTLINSSPLLYERVFAGVARMIRRLNTSYFQTELASRTLRNEMEMDRHRALSQMVAGVAHEINTPIGSVSTAASIIKARLESNELKLLPQSSEAKSAYEDVLEALSLLDRNVQRAHRLIQSFKTISVNQLVDVKEMLSIVGVIEDNLTLFRINARKSRLELIFKNQLSGHDFEWIGYQGYLSQVLMNLFTNIERYAYPNGIGGTIDITIQADDERTEPVYILTVQDFGNGIAPENLPHIFDAFFTTGRGRGGTGLGLAIVYNIVTTALKGIISIQSELEKGTTVTIVLPQVVPDEDS
jgi:signal transduction histidine kinase